jgi:hypothetical protein
MTAEARENAAAAAAQAGGEAQSASLRRESERQHRTTTGSDVAVGLTARGPEDAAVSWPSPSTAGQPPAVSPQP